MRLRSIKLAGFKSFADPTTFELPGQLVGVVGPNGCGKSNIMDAVRWVLGESKASELRNILRAHEHCRVGKPDALLHPVSLRCSPHFYLLKRRFLSNGSAYCWTCSERRNGPTLLTLQSTGAASVQHIRKVAYSARNVRQPLLNTTHNSLGVVA